MLLALTACGPVDVITTSAVATPPTPQPAPPAPAKPDSCAVLRADFNSALLAHTVPEVTYRVGRETQKTIRYSCDGKVTSDRIETVTSPRHTFDLELPKAFPHKAVFVFNETTCDHKLTRMPIGQSWLNPYAVSGDSEKKISIKGDIAQALLTFNIDPGLNRIFVRYYDSCMPANVNGNEHVIHPDDAACLGEPTSQTALFPVRIDYSETRLDGVREIHAKPEDCAKR